MSDIVKNIATQLEIIKELLRKAPEDAPSQPKPPTINTPQPASQAAPMQSSSGQYEAMKPEIENAFKTGNHTGLKEKLLNLPKGDIDIGHLGELREKYGSSRKGSIKRFAHDDLNQILSHHVGDSSLKNIYDKNGGILAIKTMMHAMGADGTPIEYNNQNNLKLKPNTHIDLTDLVNPGKGYNDRSSHRHMGILSKSPYFEKWNNDESPQARKHQEEIQKSWDAMYEHDDGYPGENAVKTKAHEDAVVARGMHIFKKAHGIKD